VETAKTLLLFRRNCTRKCCVLQYMLGRHQLVIVISMYQWFVASDISPIQHFGISIQF